MIRWKIGQDVRFENGQIGIVTAPCKAYPKIPGTFKVVWLSTGIISTENSKHPSGIEAIGGVVYTISKESRPCSPFTAGGTWVTTQTGELALILHEDVTTTMQQAKPKPKHSDGHRIGVVMLSGPTIGRRLLIAVRKLRIPQAVTANAFLHDRDKETEDE